jgi:hypothetical protein
MCSTQHACTVAISHCQQLLPYTPPPPPPPPRPPARRGRARTSGMVEFRIVLVRVEYGTGARVRPAATVVGTGTFRGHAEPHQRCDQVRLQRRRQRRVPSLPIGHQLVRSGCRDFQLLRAEVYKCVYVCMCMCMCVYPASVKSCERYAWCASVTRALRCASSSSSTATCTLRPTRTSP